MNSELVLSASLSTDSLYETKLQRIGDRSPQSPTEPDRSDYNMTVTQYDNNAELELPAPENNVTSADMPVDDAKSLLRAHEVHSHLNFVDLRHQLNLPPASAEFPNPHCYACSIVKARAINKNTAPAQGRATKPIHRLHMDIVGPIPTTLQGERGFQLFVDDFSRKSWLQFLKSKKDAGPGLLELKRTLENEKFPLRLAFVRTDSESIYAALTQPLREMGVQHEMSAPYHHEQNGVVERKVQTLVWKASAAMRHGGKPPPSDFKFALIHTNFVLNSSPTSANINKLTPNEMWACRQLPPNKLIKGVLFSLCFAKLYNRGKLDDRAVECIFLGASEYHKASTVRSLRSGRVLFSRDVTFPNDTFPYRLAESSPLPRSLLPTPHRPAPRAELADDLRLLEEKDSAHTPLLTPDADSTPDVEPRRSERGQVPSESFIRNLLQTGDLSGMAPTEKLLNRVSEQKVDQQALLVTTARLPDPKDRAEAESDKVKWRDFWFPGLLKEYALHEARNTYKLIERNQVPHGSKIFDPRLVFTHKYTDPDDLHPVGELKTPGKVRLTIAAFTQALKEKLDYKQKYASNVRWNSVRIILAIIAYNDWEMCKFDIETFFLWGDLKASGSECLYMELPPYFELPEHLQGKDVIWQVVKSIYGCPQAAYCAQQKLIKCLTANGTFRRTTHDDCVYVLIHATENTGKIIVSF